ncbi:MAG: class II aldolase/adducin family protein, partial [Myxococcota bacterium]
KLSDHAVTALAGRRACLLANHGQIAVGSDLEEALRLAEEVEELARQYLQALTVAEPVLLSREEMTAVLRRFETYR